MLPRYNKTIVARCDWGPWVLYTLGGKMAPSASPRVLFPPSGVQNTMDPVTACNNCIMLKNFIGKTARIDLYFDLLTQRKSVKLWGGLWSLWAFWYQPLEATLVPKGVKSKLELIMYIH